MKRLVLAAAASALAALLVPTASLAKGASEATISGPGLGDGIKLAGEDAPDGGTLMLLAENAGFFPALFQTSPNPMLTERPKGSLGPRYRITYAMPGPDAIVNQLRQDLYPYAKPYALSYTKPGQRFWDRGQTTHGGWFLTTSAVRTTLGLPAQPPAAGADDGSGWLRWVALAITIAAVLALIGVLSVVALRRRPGPATA